MSHNLVNQTAACVFVIMSLCLSGNHPLQTIQYPNSIALNLLILWYNLIASQIRNVQGTFPCCPLHTLHVILYHHDPDGLAHTAWGGPTAVGGNY